jgi:hypothetical protein
MFLRQNFKYWIDHPFNLRFFFHMPKCCQMTSTGRPIIVATGCLRIWWKYWILSNLRLQCMHHTCRTYADINLWFGSIWSCEWKKLKEPSEQEIVQGPCAHLELHEKQRSKVALTQIFRATHLCPLIHPPTKYQPKIISHLGIIVEGKYTSGGHGSKNITRTVKFAWQQIWWPAPKEVARLK